MASSHDHLDEIPQARSPMRELLTLAAPVAATMLSYTLAQFVDSLMVARLSPAHLAAQGNGGIIAWTPIAVFIGVFTLINTFVSQHVGAGDPRKGPAYAWNGLWLCLIVWIALLIPLAASLEPAWTGMLGAVEHISDALGGSIRAPHFSQQIIDMQVQYASILLYGSVFTLGARALSQFFFGVHRPATVLVATLAGNLVNIGVNYCLIFGNLGFPRLEMTGAAIGTVIGSAVEFVIPLFVFLGPSMHRRFGTRLNWRPSLTHMRRIFAVGWPAGAMVGNELLCWTVLLTVIIGGISEADNAAGWIALRYMQISFMPALGISIAVTAIVGRYIGMGRRDVAIQRAWLGMRVTMIYMGACAACFVIFRHPMIRLFLAGDASPQMTADVMRIGSLVMICAAVFQLFDAMGITMIGALRGAGDTIWPGVVTATLSWSLLIAGAWAMAAGFPELRSLGPWIAAAAYIVLLAIAMVGRFHRGAWKSINLLTQPSLPDVEAAAGAVAGQAALTAAPIDADSAGEREPAGDIAGGGRS